MRIGYQGISGSNSEAAAIKYVKDNNLDNVELIPLVNSNMVVKHLEQELIDVGLMAVYNSIGGTVIETQESLKDKSFKEVYAITLPIHHCLFKKKNVDIEQVEIVASHLQALIQTRKTRQSLFPDLIECEVQDTALAAKELSENILNDNYAVICRKNAGEYYGLELVAENIEDRKDNQTTFKIYKK